MNEIATVTRTPPSAPLRRTDGQDGPPQMAPPPPASTPGAPNSALKEAPPKTGEGVRRDHPLAAHLRIVDAEAGLVAPPEGVGPRRNIAVCGFASSSRQYIPIDDGAWEIWALNQLYRHLPRADRHFDIHWNWEMELVPGTEGEGEGSYRAWLRECGIPFYQHTRVPAIPTSVRYPIDTIIKHFATDYFTSTIAYMLALAIWEIDGHVRTALAEAVRRTPKRQLAQLDLLAETRRLYEQFTIGIFGVDLIVGEEYFWQKACAEYWVGQASARGIIVAIPPTSALCRQMVRYGYEREPDSLLKLHEVEQHLKALTAERDEQLKRLYMLEGAIADDTYFQQAMELRSRGGTVEILGK